MPSALQAEGMVQHDKLLALIFYNYSQLLQSADLPAGRQGSGQPFPTSRESRR